MHSVTVAGNDTGFAMQTRRYLGNIPIKIMAGKVVGKIDLMLKYGVDKIELLYLKPTSASSI